MTNCIMNGKDFIQQLMNNGSIITRTDNYGNPTYMKCKDKHYALSYHDNGNLAFCLYTNKVGSLLYHFDTDGNLITTTTPMSTSMDWKRELFLTKLQCIK